MNCWEYMRCGREPGGEKSEELGVCPAASEIRADGLHGGSNGGRVCWAIAGTLCRNQAQGTFVEKFRDCAKCDFFHTVYEEEGNRFLNVSKIAYQVFHNCWEYMECGREPGGRSVGQQGICPASVEAGADGLHGGKNGGRACWVIAGTFCKGQKQGTFVKKFNDCMRCDFLSTVQKQEGGALMSPEEMLNTLEARTPVTR